MKSIYIKPPLQNKSKRYFRGDPSEERPIRYCSRCGAEIYYGRDTLCDACLEETGGRAGMIEYAKAWPTRFWSFLEENRDAEWMDRFFEELYSHLIGERPDGPGAAASHRWSARAVRPRPPARRLPPGRPATGKGPDTGKTTGHRPAAGGPTHTAPRGGRHDRRRPHGHA